MPSPSKIKQDNPPRCRFKTWHACLALTAVPIYATTLFLIGRMATIDVSMMAAHPPHRHRVASIRERVSKSSARYRSLAGGIAAKWNLTSPDAPYLVEQQFYKASDYDPRTDFLHFHHIPKTGGTSISDLINATVGALAVGHRGILPGSGRSSPFDARKFYNLTGISPSSSDTNAEFPYLASYAHTRLRPIHGPNKTELASFFEEYFALPNNTPKRLRSLAMLREPMDLRASNHAMAMCGLNGKVNYFNWRRKMEGLERICAPEQGLNISSLIDPMVNTAMAKCPGRANQKHKSTKLDRHEKMLCRRGRTAMDYCRSPSHLLRSRIYQRGMRSMLKGLMARFTAEQSMEYVNGFTSVEEHLERTGVGFSVHKVEEYTLIDLGGLDPNVRHTAHHGYGKDYLISEESDGADANYAEPDFVWFGVTERMKESTCLFYYTLNVKPLAEIPALRVMNCPPTSWWTEEHRDEVKRRERADYAVWRAANSILDARMLKMREDVRSKLENEQGLTSKKRDQYRALADAGCLD